MHKSSEQSVPYTNYVFNVRTHSSIYMCVNVAVGLIAGVYAGTQGCVSKTSTASTSTSTLLPFSALHCTPLLQQRSHRCAHTRAHVPLVTCWCIEGEDLCQQHRPPFCNRGFPFLPCQLQPWISCAKEQKKERHAVKGEAGRMKERATGIHVDRGTWLCLSR